MIRSDDDDDNGDSKYEDSDDDVRTLHSSGPAHRFLQRHRLGDARAALTILEAAPVPSPSPKPTHFHSFTLSITSLSCFTPTSVMYFDGFVIQRSPLQGDRQLRPAPVSGPPKKSERSRP